MIDVVALGELLIDFAPMGFSDQGSRLFAANPGGAPANVLVALTRLGHSTAYISKVGSDTFGDDLIKTLEKEGVIVKNILRDKKIHTTLAFVSLNEKGDRTFSFCRNPGADLMLRSDEIQYSLIDECKIFHVGTLSLTNNPAKNATLKALEYAKSKSKFISLDPNIRLSLWEDEKDLKAAAFSIFPFADFIKISDEELTYFTGIEDYKKAGKFFFDKYSLKMLAVTLGPKGAWLINKNGNSEKPTYPLKAVDTTGAGDAFVGACLAQILSAQKAPEDFNKEELSYIVDFANATGSLSVIKYGGIPSLPYKKDVLELMSKQ